VQKPSDSLLMIMVHIAVALLLYGTMMLPRDLFVRLTLEDGFIENLGAIFLLAAAVAYFLLFLRATWFKDEADQNRYQAMGWRYAFLLLAFVHLFGFGEEISWGQRIFGYATPEMFAERNIQNELTIHNLDIFNSWTADDQQKSGWARLFTSKHIFLEVFGFYLLVLPLLNKYSLFSRNLLRRLHVPVPSIQYGWYFAFNLILYQILKDFLASENRVRWGFREVQECVFAYILFLVPFHWLDLHKVLFRNRRN